MMRGAEATDPGAGLDVLIVSPGFPAHEADDQCLPALQVLWKALPTFLPEASLRALSLHYPFEAGGRSWNGIDVTDVGGRNQRWPWRVFALARAWSALGRLTRGRRPSVIHAFFLRDAGLVASRFAQRHGIPCVGTLVGQDSRPSNRYLPAQGAFAALVAESERAADLYASHQARRPSVIPWGVERVAGPLRPRDERGIDLLGVGALSALKDYGTFVRVATRLRQEGRLRRAVLLGDGPERGALEARIAAAGLEGVIECRGAVPHPVVLEAMMDARVLLHPSTYEGFGMVFAEARSRGMSVVSRAVGAAAEAPDWSLCEGDEDFVAACRNHLSPGFPAGSPPADCLVEVTVRRYAAIYREVLSGAAPSPRASEAKR